MSRKRNDMPLIEGLEITALAAEGKAMGRWNDIVVFVPLCVAGDVVDVQVRSRRRRFMEGVVVRWVRRSPLRAEPLCEHFGVCGGCKWQNLPYDEQLRQKRQQVVDQLTRIAKVPLPEIAPCLPSERTQFYRNKLEFTFADRRWYTSEEVASGAVLGGEPALGFHIPGKFDKVLDIRKCWLQEEPSNAVRNAVREFCAEAGVGAENGTASACVARREARSPQPVAAGAGADNGYTFHNARDHTGLMRNLVIRTSSTGETMVIVVFGADDQENDKGRIAALMDMLTERFPQITSLMYVINPKLNDSTADLPVQLWSGRDHIFEKMEELRFRIGPKSFYQTNSAQAYNLYKVVREMAGLTGGETLYDLYTGTGTIALFLASQCKQVVGIEYVPEAIEDARTNAALNRIENCTFHAGDMKKVLCDSFIAAHGHPDVVVLDPPRAGIDQPVAETLLRAAPERIVYVSCNSATQARDIALLGERYSVEAVQPVDMFPHTHHVENVVKLVKKNS